MLYKWTYNLFIKTKEMYSSVQAIDERSVQWLKQYYFESEMYYCTQFL